MKPEQIKSVLATAGIPVPDGDLVNARYRARSNDWYVQTRQGWLWWDERARQWKPQPIGP